MLRLLHFWPLWALLGLSPAREAVAQDNTLGGAINRRGIGAIVGGAATARLAARSPAHHRRGRWRDDRLPVRAPPRRVLLV